MRTGAVRWAAAMPAPAASGLTRERGARRSGPDLRRARRTRSILTRRRWSDAAPTASSGWPRRTRCRKGRRSCSRCSRSKAGASSGFFTKTRETGPSTCSHPGLDDPEEGYVDYAGFAPGTRRLLIAREVKEHGRFRRRFEELSSMISPWCDRRAARSCCAISADGRTLPGGGTRSRCTERGARLSEYKLRNTSYSPSSTNALSIPSAWPHLHRLSPRARCRPRGERHAPLEKEHELVGLIGCDVLLGRTCIVEAEFNSAVPRFEQ